MNREYSAATEGIALKAENERLRSALARVTGYEGAEIDALLAECDLPPTTYTIDSDLDALIERYTQAIEGSTSDELARLLSRARNYILSARDYTRSASQHEALSGEDE